MTSRLTRPHSAFDLYLTRERQEVPLLLRDGERVVEIEPAVRGGRPGLLVVTTHRLLHLYFRRIFRRITVFEAEYERIDALLISVPLVAIARMELHYKKRFRTPSFTVLAGAERALQLAHVIRAEAERSAQNFIRVARL